MRKGLIALLDCNNFFVSCERVFRPDLWRKPVIVLSSNDGCVVARSNETKKLGVPMGVPFFQVKELIAREKIQIFSGNFPLYEDMSRRVMKIAGELSDEIERYSIDESFLTLYGEEADIVVRAKKIKEQIENGTGIPVSIGIANTKTLAKLASRHAKKNDSSDGVILISEENRAEHLRGTLIGEIWGVGGKTSLKLSRYGIRSAYDLANSSNDWLRSNLGLGTLRTAFELRGERAITGHSINKSKLSVLSSRSFGKKTGEYKALEEAVASHISSATRKIRQENSCAGYVSVSIQTARSGSVSGRTLSGFRELLFPTNDTIELIKQAHLILEEIYNGSVTYGRVGVLLSDLSPQTLAPTESLFEESESKSRAGLMETLDAIDKKYGKNTIFPAVVGLKQSWSQRQEFRSPRYTTEWNEIPVIKI